MPITRTRTALLAMTGLSAIGILTGCSTGASSGGAAADSAAPAPAGSTGASTDASASSAPTTLGSIAGTYKDGSYTEQGTYSSPGGQELISVKLEIASDAVKSVTVKTVKADPTATSYEAKFISGISKAIVGKKIDDLHVTNVAGSSLTSQGFDDALSKIKTDAKA